MESYTKNRPFNCYYCKKTIQNDTQQGHISVCGSVLEPCHNKCGSYIPRNMKSRHMKECVNSKSKSMSRLSSVDNPGGYLPNNTDNMSNTSGPFSGYFDKSNGINSTMEEVRDVKVEIHKIRNKLQDLEHFKNQIHQNTSALKNKYQETAQMQQSVQIQSQLQSEKIQYQNQMMMEWKKSIELQLEQMKHEIKDYNTYKTENNTTIQNMREKINAVEKLEKDIGLINQILVQEQIFNRESCNDLQGKFNELKDHFTQENALVGALWTDHKNSIEHLNHSASNIYKMLDEHKTKHSSLIFDLRTTTQIAAEASEKLELQEQKIDKITKDLTQMKLDLQTLEEMLINNLTRVMSNEPGRLMWKINEFASKFENARERDIVLRSPIIHTHNYGYKIRLEMYLNGIKKWKGRHMIANIQVLKGEYDLLLKWPCYIEGNIKIRDLDEHNNPKDFSKPISAKRHSGNEENEEPQESSTQYIFVPHTTLFKDKYIKEDTMFIELEINSFSKYHNETDL